MEPKEIRERLSGFIAEQGGFALVTIENLKRMAGGAVREIWSFDAVTEKDGCTVRRGMVLRRDLPGHKLVTSRHDEFLVLRAAHRDGVPVPEVLWLCEDPGVLGSAFFIMERIEGESIPRRLLRDQAYARARQVMPQQLAAILAQIHKIDVKRHQLDFLPAPADSPARTGLTSCDATFRELTLEPHPAFELAMRWLVAHLPKSSRQALVHGDFRIGNVIFGPKGARAILDWEFAHLGDPLEDLAWICVRSWRFMSRSSRPSGLGSRSARCSRTAKISSANTLRASTACSPNRGNPRSERIIAERADRRACGRAAACGGPGRQR